MPRIADRGRHRPYVAELGTAAETTATDTTNTTNTTHCIHYGVPVLVDAQRKAKSPVSGTWSTSHKVLWSWSTPSITLSQGSNKKKSTKGQRAACVKPASFSARPSQLGKGGCNQTGKRPHLAPSRRTSLTFSTLRQGVRDFAMAFFPFVSSFLLWLAGFIDFCVAGGFHRLPFPTWVGYPWLQRADCLTPWCWLSSLVACNGQNGTLFVF